ncbi:prepilin-type N-terminal cleavage/methylation domain-containing protein [Candidatus Sumerlaeota bacterium]|nr:prepilin-type N-terminal cleavage/methylation domain-containing protein [Candidatus Sumerlaeales bacterium]NLD60905.1 prepilin-type N-terminal cleavage/methylation domain-containing protein [Candidatus Sumerlaeota bacterium]
MLSVATQHKSFTLIELLIVVAIIAILAAIAVPNFLEAQVRAKVSHTHNDLRNLSLALESYRVDLNSYPSVGNPAAPKNNDILTPFYERLYVVTTPIAYMTELPDDPFAIAGATAGVGMLGDELPFDDETYCYAPGDFYFVGPMRQPAPNLVQSTFSVAGRGPDHQILFGNLCMGHPQARKTNAIVRGVYDSTNGTLSAGDIIRVGGTVTN